MFLNSYIENAPRWHLAVGLMLTRISHMTFHKLHFPARSLIILLLWLLITEFVNAQPPAVLDGRDNRYCEACISIINQRPKERAITVYGMINVRTDGEKVIIAQKLERPAAGRGWDIHKLEWNEDIEEFEYLQYLKHEK